MPPIAIEKSFCTTREAATLLGVSVGTVQLWVESGLLRAWKTAGGHRRVLRDSVERLLRRTPEPTADTNQADTLPPNQPRKLNVLVVEDDRDLLRLYQVNLSRWPMQPNVTCIDNAVAALMLLGRGGPDLLITDLHMPGMDGFAMLRVLNKAPEMRNTKMVVVSGLSSEAIAAQGGLPAGVQVLPKPIPFELLQALASNLTQQSNFQLPAA
jgi:excisionase family DNA binding protein